jgi:hypothetical protein
MGRTRSIAQVRCSPTDGRRCCPDERIGQAEAPYFTVPSYFCSWAKHRGRTLKERTPTAAGSPPATSPYYLQFTKGSFGCNKYLGVANR